MICVGIGIVYCFLQTAGGTAIVCPPVRPWTPAFQQQVAKELRAAQQGSALAQVVIQSIGDRDVARACQKASLTKP